MADTIFALSSGAPPAAIAVVRISGSNAGDALRTLAGRVPKSRRATLCALRDAEGALLDRALVLWLPGPQTATGEDTAELHLHGGRALVAAVEAALERLPGLRRAEAGEFTRRAFVNGRIDLAEAEGLADLLAAETELQRRSALAMASGALSQLVEGWRTRVLRLAAQVEAALDFADEDDVTGLPEHFADDCAGLADELAEWLAMPRAEPLRDGLRIVLAGPPNAGKSSLFNRLTGSEGAITSPIPGTTRDVLTRAVAIDGVPFVFADTAGLRAESVDPIEAEGIGRARSAVADADLVLWLGAEGAGSGEVVWEISAKSDDPAARRKDDPRHVVSSVTGAGIEALRSDLIAYARSVLPKPGALALGERQRSLIAGCRDGVAGACLQADLLLAAESLRIARMALDRLIGRSGTDDMLDALFGRFCIGK